MATLRYPLVGCAGFGPAPQRYFDELAAVELTQTFIHPPRPRTLTRWREAAPDGFGFVVRAWQLVTHEPSSPSYQQLPRGFTGSLEGAGHLQGSEVVREALAKTFEVARALDAAAVLFETPPSFTPTPTHRGRLTRFFEGCERPATLVWCPAGLWQADEVVRICRDLQLVPGLDPFTGGEALEREPSVYLRPLGLGAEHRHTEAELRWLASQLVPHERAYCVFGSPWLFDEARQLRELIW